MIPECIDRGPIRWYTYHRGIRGGIVRLLIYKNRLSFVKNFYFLDNEDYNLALRILKDKVARILHMKNEKYPQIYRLANYTLDATDVIEVTPAEFDNIFQTLQ